MEFVFPIYASGVSGTLETLAVLARQGVRAVEWNLAAGRFADETRPDHVDAFRRTLEREGIRVNSIHSPFGVHADIASLDPQNRSETFEAQAACISLARQVGARFVVVHPGQAPRGPEIVQRLSLAAEALAALEPLARDAGVILAVENLPPDYPGNSAEEVLTLVRAVDSPHVRVCFDSGHAHLCGDAAGIARAVLPFAATMHLHDNDGRHDLHLLPGRGKLDWVEFGRIYRETGCLAPAMLECKPPDDWRWPESANEVRLTLGL